MGSRGRRRPRACVARQDRYDGGSGRGDRHGPNEVTARRSTERRGVMVAETTAGVLSAAAVAPPEWSRLWQRSGRRGICGDESGGRRGASGCSLGGAGRDIAGPQAEAESVRFVEARSIHPNALRWCRRRHP